jgi:hypothetical protein
MSEHNESPHRQFSDPKTSSSRATGTLTGTITNLANGTTYQALANFYRRFSGTYPRIDIVGLDPEGIGEYFEINVNFDTAEPPSGTYTVGSPGWRGCTYSRWPDEEFLHATSGKLQLLNFESTSHLEGELIFDTRVGSEGRQYRVNVKFSIIGW